MATHSTSPVLLAPAGNWDCARAAAANGADAIYFGLQAFNARMRADNFTNDNLPELMAWLHARGMRGFVTMNVLIFTDELETAATQLRLLEDAGVDAVIIQDVGLARLARAVAPGIDLHASTQMTITAPEGLDFIHQRIPLDTAVIARENSLREIKKFRKARSDVPLEAFVHGALCVAYSGQCLTSESLGQRSANRGECAQACRMPYTLVCDGEPVDLGDRQYLLSPQDLAGIDLVPDLIEAGVATFKIEGRLKTPEYVAAVTGAYRRAIDAAGGGIAWETPPEDRYALEMAFSRGLHSGWLRGANHPALTHGRFGKKRGAYVGTVCKVDRASVWVMPECPLHRGDGVVFDTGEDTDREQGGRLYSVGSSAHGTRLTFEHGRIDFQKVPPGTRVWKTDDPQLNKQLRATLANADQRLRQSQLDFRVSGHVDAPLVIEATAFGVRVESTSSLQPARNRCLDEATLRDKLSRLGGTGFDLGSLTVDLPTPVFMPLGELNSLRRVLIAKIAESASTHGHLAKGSQNEASAPPEPSTILSGFMREAKAKGPTGSETDSAPSAIAIAVLCREEAQMHAALKAGADRIYLDFEDIRRFRPAVESFREAATNATSIHLATPRIQKAGEDGYFRLMAKAEPDGFLIRNLGAIDWFSREAPDATLTGDFSLNVANPLTADFFLRNDLQRITASYDLNAGQVLALAQGIDAQRLEVTIHQHMPMFHMEHCVFCTFLSNGTDYTNCGRPCEKHQVHLRDRVGQLHPLKADVGCRNTLFNGRSQSGAGYWKTFIAAGIRHFRIELLNEDPTETNRIIKAYQGLVKQDAPDPGFWQKINALNKLGVTEGTLRELG